MGSSGRVGVGDGSYLPISELDVFFADIGIVVTCQPKHCCLSSMHCQVGMFQRFTTAVEKEYLSAAESYGVRGRSSFLVKADLPYPPKNRFF